MAGGVALLPIVQHSDRSEAGSGRLFLGVSFFKFECGVKCCHCKSTRCSEYKAGAVSYGGIFLKLLKPAHMPFAPQPKEESWVLAVFSWICPLFTVVGKVFCHDMGEILIEV